VYQARLVGEDDESGGELGDQAAGARTARRRCSRCELRPAITGDAGPSDVKVVVLATFELDEYVFERSAPEPPTSWSRTPSRTNCRARYGRWSRATPCAAVLTRRLIAEFAARSKEPAAAAGLEQLTEHEREVTALVGVGLSNEEIAARLVVSPFTAKTHVSRTMVELGVRDRAQLVVLAYESGLVRPGWLG